MTDHECDKCGRSFGSEEALEQHLDDYDHSKVTECPDCGETFTSEDAYEDHRHEHRNTVQEIAASLNWKHGATVGILALIAVGILMGATGSTDSGPSASPSPSGEVGTQIGMTAPNATFTTLSGETKQLSDYRGQKVMFWLFATWCPSCKQGARALQANNDKLQDMEIVAVKTAGNAGYAGPSVHSFVESFAPSLLTKSNWVWGELSQQSTRTFNPRNRPDIYYLIDENGTIQAKTGAPAATMNQITQFAQTETTTQNTDSRPGTSYDIQGRQHIQPGESHPDYNSNPPTSGGHYSESADWGFYSKKLPDERVVHNLEHGGIWVSYTNNVSRKTLDDLRSLAQQYPKSVIVTKRPANDAPIAVASWGRLMELQQFDRQRITTFIEENMNNSPEPFAGR
jgi:thiol-disulfide isomerase/thioredoxin